MQLSELREYATRRGLSIHEEYVDQGVSGSKESRPALNRLMADGQRCRFDAVLVWKIDRFGRSLKHLVNSLADLSAYGIAFISLRDRLYQFEGSPRPEHSIGTVDVSDHRGHG